MNYFAISDQLYWNEKLTFCSLDSWQLPDNELPRYVILNYLFTIFSISIFRADTRSEARSYNETIIRPVTRRLNTPAGTSYRSSRSHATTSEVNKTVNKQLTGSKLSKVSLFASKRPKIKWFFFKFFRME